LKLLMHLRIVAETTEILPMLRLCIVEAYRVTVTRYGLFTWTLHYHLLPFTSYINGVNGFTVIVKLLVLAHCSFKIITTSNRVMYNKSIDNSWN
jgi:hypothetical protein